MTTPIVSIITDSNNAYKNVLVRFTWGIEKIFSTGDPVMDYFRAMMYCMPYRPLISSSVDHFVTDNDKYQWIQSEIGDLIIYREYPNAK